MDKTTKTIQRSVRRMTQQYRYLQQLLRDQRVLSTRIERTRDRIGDQMANLVALGVDPEGIETLRATAEQYAAGGGEIRDLRLD